MDLFRFSMRLLSALLMIFFMLVILRIILSWFPTRGQGGGRIKELLHKVTQPYMRHFQGISWLKFGLLDFSPMLALVLINFFLFLTQQLAVGKFPQAGELLIWVISTVWSFMAFFLLLISIIMIVRLISLYALRGKQRPWLNKIDVFLFPRISRLMSFFTQKTISYPLALVIGIILLLGTRVLLSRLLEQYLYPWLAKI